MFTTYHSSTTRRRLLAVAVGAPLASLVPSIGTAGALPVATPTPPAKIVNIESDLDYDDTTTPDGTVVYAVTAPTKLGHSTGWWLRLDVRVQNTGSSPISVTGLTVDTDRSSPLTSDLDEPVVIAPRSSKVIKIPDDLYDDEGSGPTTLVVKAHLAGYASPVSKSAPLQAFASPTSSKGYAFPGRLNDLTPGTYWSAGVHAHAVGQRYAYDFGARRWDAAANKWTGWTPGAVAAAASGGPALGTANDQWLIWNTPVYAVADATIVRCFRSVADNVPGAKTSGGGNGVILDVGDGTFIAYYHLRQNTVPAALCPIEGPVGSDFTPLAIPVAKGTFLGRVGNSGHSSGPHLHFQLSDSPTSTSSGLRSLPLRFTGIKTHTYVDYNPETDSTGWATIGPRTSAVPYKDLIKPPCVGGCAITLP